MIELCGGYKLDCLQDYSPDDVAVMKVEIERFRTLSEALGALR
ncbi:hypothetical protein [Nocardiopsis sp. JB363]|nr:hypothetical protein [Nocardiopsis sp. JB363]SIO86990.1 hypothetical protein BQ8420_14605 [Nocardiopsis sp. JB363]